MFINLNYSLSIILHLLVVCCLIFIFKIEKQTNIYNDVININLKTLKNFKTEDIAKEENFIDIKTRIIAKILSLPTQVDFGRRFFFVYLLSFPIRNRHIT